MHIRSLNFERFHFQMLCDGAPEDPNYNPLPEDRPGGFEWGNNQQDENRAQDEDRPHQD